MLKLKQSLARNLFRLFIVLMIFKAPAVLAVTCPTWFGGQLCDGGGKSWCYQNNITNGCQVETTCSPISNGTNTNNCLTNTCVIECSEGYIECSSNCQTPLLKPANCSTHNPCTGVCTVCNAGYELSGSSTCVSAILKLGINSVSGSNVVQAATGALLYVNNTGVGIGTNNPSSSLHIIGHVTLSEDLSMAAGKSIKLNNAANTILYIGNYHTGGFAFGSGQTASIHVEGDVRANKLCIKDDCKSAWSEIQGTNYWTASGNNIYSSNSGNVGIGTASPATKLHVAGTIRTGLSGTGNRCLYVTSDGDIAAKSVDCGTATGGDNLGDHVVTQNLKLGSYWLSGDGGNEGISVDSSGKVGIGTSAPGSLLQIDSPSSATIYSMIRLRNPNTSAGSAGTSIDFITNNTVTGKIANLYSGSNQTNLIFSIYAGSLAEAMRINSSGNLGIGTTSPAYKLAVAGDAYFSSPITVQTPTLPGHAVNRGYIDGLEFAWTKLMSYPDGCVPGQFISAIGDTLTCGTPASTAYTAGGGLTLTDSVFSVNTTVVRTTGTQTIGGAKTFSTTPLTLSAASAILSFSSGTGTKEITTGAGTHLNLNPAYNVGIGTTSPAAKLAVAGTGLFTGAVTVATPSENNHATTKAYVDGRIVPWNKINTFPAACGNGQYVRAIGSTLTCGTPTGTSHNPLTLGDIGSSPNATGASLDDQKLMLQPASASYGGIVTTGPQTFAGTKTFNSTIIGNINTATALANDGTNCSAGNYPLGIDASGNAQNCTVLPTGGTYSADGRGIELSGDMFSLKLDGTTLSKSESGLKVNAIGSTEISDGAITNADISGVAAIDWSKISKVGSNLTDLATRSHASLTNLTNDDHTQYVLSAGRAISQSIKGSTAANGKLQLQATSHGTVTPTSAAIQFFVNSWGADQAMTILHNGNIGISKINPAYKLDVGGDLSVTGSFKIGTTNVITSGRLIQSANGAASTPAFSFSGDTNTGIYSGGTDILKFSTNSNDRMTILANGNVGVSTIAPAAKLHVEGGIMVSSGSNNIHIYNEAGQALINYDNSDFGAKLIIRKFDEDMMTFASGPEVTIGDGGDSKLNVGTVDPIYTIDGQKYATYMAGMTGVKEETSGALVLNKQSAGLFMAKLDFQNVPTGSDIWLFGRTTNLIDNQEHFDQTSCLLTPNFAGQTWYEKDWDGRSINIFARPDNINRASIEVSYRLTAPRFDQKNWTNYSDSQHDGFNLDKLLK